MSAIESLSVDEQRLAELGYKQELNRGWSGFSNFAISLTIICILSGCFTTYGQAWNYGGPVAISIGWPATITYLLSPFGRRNDASICGIIRPSFSSSIARSFRSAFSNTSIS